MSHMPVSVALESIAIQKAQLLNEGRSIAYAVERLIPQNLDGALAARDLDAQGQVIRDIENARQLAVHLQYLIECTTSGIECALDGLEHALCPPAQAGAGTGGKRHG